MPPLITDALTLTWVVTSTPAVGGTMTTGSRNSGDFSSAQRSRPLAVPKYSFALLLQSLLLSLEPPQER